MTKIKIKQIFNIALIIFSICFLLIITWQCNGIKKEVETKHDVETSIIYSCDLGFPAGDPDDHFDLLTLFSLKNLNIKAIVLDNIIRADDKTFTPNFNAVINATVLFNRKEIPTQSGLLQKLKSPKDESRDSPEEHQKAIKLIINQLKVSASKSVIIITTGSLRDICAAYNREPKLFHDNVLKLIVSIGDSYGLSGTRDYNTAQDLEAWKGLMLSGLTIDWMPANPSKLRGGPSRYVSYWYFMQDELLSQTPNNIKQFLISENISMTSRRARHMWSTPAFIEVAELSCYKIGNKLKWMSSQIAKNIPSAKICYPYEFVPIKFSLNENNIAVWKEVRSSEKTNMRILKINDYYLYNEAMFQFLLDQFNN